MKYYTPKKAGILRPEVEIECSSYLMCVYIMARIYLKFFRCLRVVLTMETEYGEKPVEERKYWVIPKINVKWR